MDFVKIAIRTLLIVLAAGTFAACNSDSSPTSPPVYVGPAELQITDVEVGTGATLVAGQLITANYKLWLYDPTAVEFKGPPASAGQLPPTRLNTTQLIEGWVVGLPGMKVGGIRRLIVPPSLAYGSAGRDNIPPNAWLVFDVQLLTATD
jgi:FKBP-type peptidyl-prolyl cis-trans isomerase